MKKNNILLIFIGNLVKMQFSGKIRRHLGGEMKKDRTTAQKEGAPSKILAIGFLLAFGVAASVAAGVMGISNLYIGKYTTGIILLLFAGLSGYFLASREKSYFKLIHEPEGSDLDVPLEEKRAENVIYQSVGRIIAFCLMAFSFILIVGGAFASFGIGRWLNPIVGLFLSCLAMVLMRAVKQHKI